MKIIKSTRHAKIAGDFGEMLVLYWLSKSGFECARVDHTGIDLIAAKPNQRLGISVKSRTRLPGTEKSNVNLYKSHFSKIDQACRVFDCQPYLAIVIEAGETISVFIMPTSRARDHCTTTDAGLYWQMSPIFLNKYASDEEVMRFDLQIKHGRWWPTE
jgi:Holliday junction resolvase-like predicted endonuclease